MESALSQGTTEKSQKMQPLNVAIFTSFSDFQKAYSLNIIVQDQIKMFLRNGYKPVVIVSDPFEAPEGTIYNDPNVTIRKIPMVPVSNDVSKDETFDEDVTALEIGLE